jgi:tetratricopeptide (TPR) repeat protein
LNDRESPFSLTDHRQWLAMGAVVLGVIAILVLGREQTSLPSNLSDDTVVATLGSVTRPYPDVLRTAVANAKENPTRRDAAVEAATQYLAYGRAIGDARYVGAALGVLDPWISASPDAEVLNLAAGGRQYMHDFTGAIALLDQILMADPRNAQALFSRANIHVVQGRFATAAEDCRGLARARRPDLAILCDTTAKALTAEAPMVAERLDRLIASKGLDPALVGYAQSLLAEIARFSGDHEVARQKFSAALAASPDDLRTLMILVDFDLAEGRPDHALARLAPAPVTDSIMVRQLEGHLATGDNDAADALAAILRGSFEEATAGIDTTHAREAARFWLLLRDNDRALAAATANWANQRELEDALLLVAAAKAADNPAAAAPVYDWAAAEGVVAPMYLAATDGSAGAAK